MPREAPAERSVEWCTPAICCPPDTGVHHGYPVLACSGHEPAARVERPSFDCSIPESSHRGELSDDTLLELHGDDRTAVGRASRFGHGSIVAVRQTCQMLSPLILASSSRYRAAVLEEAGYLVRIDPPHVDERALDHLLGEQGAEVLATALARLKAESVVDRHAGGVVVAGDQVAVLDSGGCPQLLTKQPTPEGAVAQLAVMSGTTHELINALVVVDVDTGEQREGIDRQRVTMREFTPKEARLYVERFEPFDSAGSYRLEDQDRMGSLAPFVTAVVGEHPSGVLGMPLPLLERLLTSLGHR